MVSFFLYCIWHAVCLKWSTLPRCIAHDVAVVVLRVGSYMLSFCRYCCLTTCTSYTASVPIIHSKTASFAVVWAAVQLISVLCFSAALPVQGHSALIHLSKSMVCNSTMEICINFIFLLHKWLVATVTYIVRLKVGSAYRTEAQNT